MAIRLSPDKGGGLTMVGSTRWYSELTVSHAKVLIGSFLGWVFDGYENYAIIVVLGPVLKSLLTPEQFRSPAIWAGLVIGAVLLGWGIGGLVGGILADYIGRKTMMMWSVFLYALLSGLTAFSTSIWMLLAFRFLTGLAMGSEWSTGISLINETWPERARAKGAGFLQSGFGFGTLLAALLWFLIADTKPFGFETWRLMFVFGALPAVFLLYIWKGVQESERWKQAIREKRWAATEVASQVASGAAEGKRPFTLAEVFRESESRRRVILCFVLSVVTMIGWYAVASWLALFSVSMAVREGLPNAQSWGAWIAMLYTVGAITAYLLAGFIADGMGRRKYLIFTFLGCLVFTPIMYHFTPTVFAMQFVAPMNGFFTLGCAYSWMAIYPAELFTSSVRSTAISFVFNGSRLIAFFFPVIAGTMINSFGGIANTAMILGTIYVIGLIVPIWLPETKGKGLAG
jgi:MFS family permease